MLVLGLDTCLNACSVAVLDVGAAGGRVLAHRSEAMAPDVLPSSASRALTLVGSGAPLLADTAPGAAVLVPEGCDARHVARLAAARPVTPIRPLYLRAPDAKLPGGGKRLDP